MAHGVTLKLRKIQPRWYLLWPAQRKGTYRKYRINRAVARNVQFRRGQFKDLPRESH